MRAGNEGGRCEKRYNYAVPQPKAHEVDDDETDDLPRDEGPAGESVEREDDFDPERLAPDPPANEDEGNSWLGEDGVEGIEVPDGAIDVLDEESGLDDSTLAIDDDPLELDAESTWTDGSEAEGSLFVGELIDGEEAASRSADDGADGLPEDETPELESSAASVAGEGDELADDLAVSEGEAALKSQVLPFRDELTVGIASFEGELVQVTPRVLYVGVVPIELALDPGETLAGATPLDDEHLLIWSSRGRAQVLAVFVQRAIPLEVVVHRAFGDGLGGAWILGEDGALAHLAAAPRTERLGEPRGLGRVRGAFEIAGTRREADVLWVLAREGETSRLLALRSGEVSETLLAAPPTALTVDEDDRLLVALGTSVVLAAVTGPRTSEPDDGPAITAMCTVDRTLVILRDARASRHERP
jgi:hypothetical protein